jgi:hypothetical protein
MNTRPNYPCRGLRIILRHLVISDLEAHHSLRGLSEIVARSRRGEPDAIQDEILAHLKRMSTRNRPMLRKRHIRQLSLN